MCRECIEIVVDIVCLSLLWLCCWNFLCLCGFLWLCFLFWCFNRYWINLILMFVFFCVMCLLWCKEIGLICNWMGWFWFMNWWGSLIFCVEIGGELFVLVYVLMIGFCLFVRIFCFLFVDVSLCVLFKVCRSGLWWCEELE